MTLLVGALIGLTVAVLDRKFDVGLVDKLVGVVNSVLPTEPKV